MSRKFYATTPVLNEKGNKVHKVLDKQGFEQLVRDAIDTCPLINQEDAHFDKWDKFEVRIETEIAFGVGCTLYIDHPHFFSPLDHKDVKVVNANDASQKGWLARMKPEFVINWSSCRKTVAGAATAARLYQQFVEVAQMVEAVMEDYELGIICWEAGEEE